MKKSLALVLVLVLAFAAMFTLVACGGPSEPANPNGAVETYDITLWVSEVSIKGEGTDDEGNEIILDSVVEMTKRQIKAFEAANPGLKFNVTIEGVTEADAATKVIADVASAPDIYCFAQDQLARLVQADALQQPGKAAQDSLKNINTAGSVKAASVAGDLYAYPLTDDNGYFLFYNKSVISDPTSLTAIIADCEAAGLKFNYALENAWYTASFFFGAGCHSQWTTDTEGEFNGIDDDFNSDKGLIAMKGMRELTQSDCYVSEADKFTGSACMVTGTWNTAAAKAYFGENYAVAKLPSYTVDGTSYQLGSFSGAKLMGVKPQTDPKRGAALQKLALWLTNEANSLERFNTFGWGPANIAAQANEKVKADVALMALAAQNEFAVLQGQIHGSWWDIAKTLGAQAKAATSDADLQKALDDYDAAIDAVLNMSDEAKKAWGVIGNIGGTSWDTDFPMTKVNDTTFESAPLELHAGEKFKVRQGGSWDVNFGQTFNGANIVVEADGTYIVRLVYDESTGEGSVTLVAQQ